MRQKHAEGDFLAPLIAHCKFGQYADHVGVDVQLPPFVKPKDKKGALDYSGPVLAGGRLIVTGSNGAVISIDPANGSFLGQFSVGAPVSLPPVRN